MQNRNGSSSEPFLSEKIYLLFCKKLVNIIDILGKIAHSYDSTQRKGNL